MHFGVLGCERLHLVGRGEVLSTLKAVRRNADVGGSTAAEIGSAEGKKVL
jgi:hypothetical protein